MAASVLGVIEEQVKRYFASDFDKYARLIPVNLSQMQLLKTMMKKHGLLSSVVIL